MHRPNQAPRRLLTAALAGLVVACSLERASSLAERA